MSVKTHKPAPLRAADLPAGWIARVREALQRDGQAVRAGGFDRIEAQSVNSGAWQPLMLPGGGTQFVEPGERDAVLAELWGAAEKL